MLSVVHPLDFENATKTGFVDVFTDVMLEQSVGEVASVPY
jgi:hypothetical protein